MATNCGLSFDELFIADMTGRAWIHLNSSSDEKQSYCQSSHGSVSQGAELFTSASTTRILGEAHLGMLSGWGGAYARFLERPLRCEEASNR